MFKFPELILHPRADTDPELRRRAYPTNMESIRQVLTSPTLSRQYLISGNAPLDYHNTRYSVVSFVMDALKPHPMTHYIIAHRHPEDLATAICHCLQRMHLYNDVRINGVTLYDPQYGTHMLMRSATHFLPFQYGLFSFSPSSSNNTADHHHVLSCITVYIELARFAPLLHGSHDAAMDHVLKTLARFENA